MSIAECVYVVVLASSIKQLTNHTLTLFDSYEFQVIMIFQHAYVGVVSRYKLATWIDTFCNLSYESLKFKHCTDYTGLSTKGHLKW